MKVLPVVFLALLVGLCSCKTKSRAKAEAENAYLRGQNEALMRMQQQLQQQLQQQSQSPAAGGSVSFVGDVQNRVIPWQEELKLSKAILAAGYLGRGDPRVLAVIRHGQRYEIDLNNFLRGVDDPVLEPGDIVELRR